MYHRLSPAHVTCTVNTTGDVFSVTNTSDIDAYIRAAIVVNWVNRETGNVVGSVPAEYSYSLGIIESNEGWISKSDGFYYYQPIVKPSGAKATTAPLITEITVTKDNPATYDLLVEVVAEAIQADGGKTQNASTTPAYTDAWGITGLNTQ